MNAVPADVSVTAQRLHLSTGFHATERDWVVRCLAALGTRLRSYRDDQVDLEISLRDRDGDEQRVVLQCWISGAHRVHFVATSSKQRLSSALGEAGDDLVRQVDEAKTRTEPRHNRSPRSVAPEPGIG
ncbi:HPF/RaiA family ribosome-associated protein [Lentzea sp. NPDC055074]